MESHPRPENLDSLKVKKCNTEIWRFLFGDDLPKRIMNVITNKKLFSMPSKPYNTFFKTSKNLCRFPQIPGNRTQKGYKGITLVNNRNLTTTVTATAASNKNKRETKYGKSTWI